MYGHMNVKFVQLILSIVRLFSWLSNQDNRQSSKKNNKYQLLYTYGLPPDDGRRYARNM